MIKRKALTATISKPIVLFSGLVCSSVSLAAPNIDSVVVTTSPAGEILEINGSAFSGEPNVILFDNFESGQIGDYVRPTSAVIGSWNDLPSTGAKPYYVQESPNNKGFLARDLSQPSGSQRPILKLSFGIPYREVFVSYSVKVPENNFFAGAAEDRVFPDRSSWKFIWLMSGEGLRSSDGLLDLAIPSHVGQGSFLVGGNDGTISWVAGGSNWWSWHGFNNMTFHVKIADVNPSTSPVEWSFETVSDQNTTSKSGTTQGSEFSGTDYQFDKLHVPGWWGNGDTSNFQAIYDDVYVAAGQNAQSRVVATNRESWQESTLSTTLPALVWSESQIKVDLQLIPKWDQVYFHVVDSNGTRTPIGAAFCPLCPSPIKAELK